MEINNGSEQWLSLKNLKDSNPLQVAEYAVTNNIVDETVFEWWVPILNKRWDQIISKLKTRYW